jgi:hypothetical protein
MIMLRDEQRRGVTECSQLSVVRYPLPVTKQGLMFNSFVRIAHTGLSCQRPATDFMRNNCIVKPVSAYRLDGERSPDLSQREKARDLRLLRPSSSPASATLVATGNPMPCRVLGG